MKSSTLTRGFIAATLAAVLISGFVIGFHSEAKPASPAPKPTELTIPRQESRERRALLPPSEQTKVATRVVVPPPAPEPRDPGEWQGMLVDTSIQPPCDTSARCGLAMACVDNKCSGCVTDAQCAGGEMCVLDHCVLAKNAACRAKSDCKGEEELCVLSGYSPGARGNAEMKSYCQSAVGGLDDPTEHRLAPAVLPAEAREMSPAKLMESLDEKE